MRLTRIDRSDLGVFDFDYDLTFMVFFMDADERVYARYGGRDPRDPDSRQSLAGLRFTMQSVLAAHRGQDRGFAPRREASPRYASDLMPRRGSAACIHCHEVKETMQNRLMAEGAWTVDRAFRYPLPDALGFRLEVDRGSMVERVDAGSAASRAGLVAGDRLEVLHGVPVHSLGDAQFALDIATGVDRIPVSWWREGRLHSAWLPLPPGWRRDDIRWRPSLRGLAPRCGVSGVDLTDDEKRRLGLAPDQLAFRQTEPLSAEARAAGIRAGDVIVGIGDRTRESTAARLSAFVRRWYIRGEVVDVHVRRGETAMTFRMTLSGGDEGPAAAAVPSPGP